MGPEETIMYFCHDNTLRSKKENRESISKKVTRGVSALLCPMSSS